MAKNWNTKDPPSQISSECRAGGGRVRAQQAVLGRGAPRVATWRCLGYFSAGAPWPPAWATCGEEGEQ